MLFFPLRAVSAPLSTALLLAEKLRWSSAAAWSPVCSSLAPGTLLSPRSGSSSPKPELMSSAGSDRCSVGPLSCLHVTLTNACGGSSLLMFLHRLGCSSPSDYSTVWKKGKKSMPSVQVEAGEQGRPRSSSCSTRRCTYLRAACQGALAALFIPPFSLKISFDVFGCRAALVCMPVRAAGAASESIPGRRKESLKINTARQL